MVLLASAVPARGVPDLPVISNQTFAVTNSTFGALGNGTTNNAAAISNAIAFAASHGGGTVLIPASGTLSTYLSGPFPLASGVNLQIDSGATLKMLSFSAYPTNPVIPDFISGTSLHDVEISGSGTIDGSASSGTPGWWDGRATSARPLMIRLISCQRVLIQDLHLKNPPKMHVSLGGTGGNITIQGITINTPVSPNTDGIDLAGTNCLVQNCSISDGDDNIAFSPTVGTFDSDILISNCTFGIGHGVSMGSNTAGGLSNLTVTACSFSGTDYGIRMKSDNNTNTGGTVNGRGGLVQNLSYSNLTMTNIVRGAIVIYSYYNEVGTPTSITPFGASTQAVGSALIPVWRNITISNVTGTVGSSGIAGIIWGRKEMVVSNVTLSKINISGPKPFCLYNARGIRLVDCQFNIPGTNTLNLYNAEIAITNSEFAPNLVTLGGLATPPTNNTLGLFNTQAAFTGTNILGGGDITLGNGTFIFTGAVNLVTGTLRGRGTVRGSVMVSGTLAPDALTFSNDLVVSSGAALQYKLGTNSDLAIVRSNLTVAGILNVADAGGLADTTYTLFTYGRTLTYNGISLGSVPASHNYAISTNTPGEVDLVVTPLLTAFEQWQIDYFGSTNNPAANPNADPDGDGLSNTSEFLAGTDPTNSLSFFGITGVTAESNDIRVTWMTGTGKTNALERSAGDAGGSYSNEFTTIFTVTDTVSAVTNYLDVGGATNTPTRYYRVRLLP